MESQAPEGALREEQRKAPGFIDKIRPNGRITFEEVKQNIAADALDNMSFISPPKEKTYIGERSGEINRQIIEQFIPVHTREALLAKTRAWEVGKSTGVVVIAGNKDTCTAHPHVYEIMKTETGVHLTFVDPEPNYNI